MDLSFNIFQVLFSELFRLPNSYHPHIFYGSVIIELCKLQPNSMPGVVSLLSTLTSALFYPQAITQYILTSHLNWIKDQLDYRFSYCVLPETHKELKRVTRVGCS